MFSATLTHPETAWLIYATPGMLAAAGVLVLTLLLRGRLALALAQLQARQIQRRKRRNAAPAIDPALIWTPQTIDPHAALLICLAAVLLTVLGLSLVMPIFLALLGSVLLTLLLIWAMLNLAERRYLNRLDRDLTAAMGRLSALLKSGSGFRLALERLVHDLPPGPLHAEWSYLLTHQGIPLSAGGIATAQQVVAALAQQTSSARHAMLLNHLSVAVGQPQDVLSRRCEAAYSALQASDRRREEAITELAQVRYSGMVVGLAGIAMAGYLIWTQWDRVVLAYSSALGVIVGAIVLFALFLPIGGGLFLAQVEDVNY